MGDCKRKFSEKDLIKLLINWDSFFFKESLLDKKILPFILGSRYCYTLYDLKKTVLLLKKVCYLVEEVFSNRGRVLIFSKEKLNFKGLDNGFRVLDCNWPEGSFSNFRNLKKMLYDFKYTSMKEEKLKKRLSSFLNKYQTMGHQKNLPNLIITFSTYDNDNFLNEVQLLNIPLVSLTDTLQFKHSSDYPILCNIDDDFFRFFLLTLLNQSAKKGRIRFLSKFKIRRSQKLIKKQKKYFYRGIS